MRRVVGSVELYVIAADDETIGAEHIVEQRGQGRRTRLRGGLPHHRQETCAKNQRGFQHGHLMALVIGVRSESRR